MSVIQTLTYQVIFKGMAAVDPCRLAVGFAEHALGVTLTLSRFTSLTVTRRISDERGCVSAWVEYSAICGCGMRGRRRG